jgi:hypothetical protein
VVVSCVGGTRQGPMGHGFAGCWRRTCTSGRSGGRDVVRRSRGGKFFVSDGGSSRSAVKCLVEKHIFRRSPIIARSPCTIHGQLSGGGGCSVYKVGFMIFGRTLGPNIAFPARLLAHHQTTALTAVNRSSKGTAQMHSSMNLGLNTLGACPRHQLTAITTLVIYASIGYKCDVGENTHKEAHHVKLLGRQGVF